MDLEAKRSGQPDADQSHAPLADEPLYVVYKDAEIRVYFNGAEPRSVLNWEQAVFRLLDAWGIKHEEAGWLISEDWPPLESRQYLNITLTGTDDGPKLDSSMQGVLRSELVCRYRGAAYASYAYSELFGRRNGLGIEFKVQGTPSRKLEDLTDVLGYNISQNHPLIFDVQLRATRNPVEEAERIAAELGIFLLELPEEL